MSIVSQLNAETAPITVRQFFQGHDPGPLSATLAHVPDLLKAAMPFISTTLGASGIDIRTKEIVILRTSYLQRCHYCTNTHSMVAFKSGLSRTEVLALRDANEVRTEFSSQREQTLIQWTDVIASGPEPITRALRMKMAEHFDESEIVELTMLIGATVMLSRYATALELPLNPDHLAFLENEDLVFCC